MEVTGVSSSGLQVDFAAKYATAVMRKQKDTEEVQAQALLQLVQQVPQGPRADGTGQLIDLLA